MSQVLSKFVASGLDASKLGNGTVDNTEFQRLNNVSADLQTQIDAKATLTQTISNGDTTNAPSGDAVFDALAGKASTALDNLGTTAINANLLFSGVRDVGSTSQPAGNMYTKVLGTSADGSPLALITPNRTGANNSEAISITSGSVVDGTSGAISLVTGAESGTGARGSISLDGATINVNSKNIVSLADPVNPQDAASKAYVDSVASSQKTWNYEALTLNGTDITNQYKDLAQVAVTGSIMFFVGGIWQRPTTDYTINYTGGAGGNTRLTFAGDLATGGAAELVATDVIHIQYQY